ncbi:hypothetical protein C8Q70DRAFT_937918 [Cubamyces menziesii]|nr:hypothetical protein C8Q70DRAFT_937918 [Cubamyces menziesii]
MLISLSLVPCALRASSAAFAASPRLESRARVLAHRGSEPSPCLVTHPEGAIQVLDSSDHGNIFGFISHCTNPYDGYAATNNASDALKVVPQQGCDPAGPFQIAIVAEQLQGILIEFPSFGAVVGLDSTSDDITPDSANHAYLAGTFDAPRGPAQVRSNAYTKATGREVSVESAIWTLPDSLATDAPTALIPSRVNYYGSTASVALDVSLVYAPSAEGLVLTGNVTDFAAQFVNDV